MPCLQSRAEGEPRPVKSAVRGLPSEAVTEQIQSGQTAACTAGGHACVGQSEHASNTYRLPFTFA